MNTQSDSKKGSAPDNAHDIAWQNKVEIGQDHKVSVVAYRSWQKVADYRKRDNQSNVWDFIKMDGRRCVIVRKVSSTPSYIGVPDNAQVANIYWKGLDSPVTMAVAAELNRISAQRDELLAVAKNLIKLGIFKGVAETEGNPAFATRNAFYHQAVTAIANAERGEK